MECVGEAFRQIPLRSIKRALIELDTPKISAQNSEWSCNTGRPLEIQGGGLNMPPAHRRNRKRQLIF